MPREYAFVTKWRLAAPIDAVFRELASPEQWPSWWKYVRKVDLLEPGDERGVGSLRRFTWRTKLPYSLAFNLKTTRVEPPHLIEGVASGELDGVGRWNLLQDGDGVLVTYEWTVRTTKWWMNLVAPLARQFFEWNHDAVMREGGESLAKRLVVALR